MEYSNCKQTHQDSTIWDHGTKLTRFDKQIDNMHVSIQSRTPPKGTSPFTSKYKIEIQENNMQDIDVTVRMDSRSINVSAPSNFYRSHTQSQEMIENHNADRRSRYEYQINYAREQQNKSKENFQHESYWDTKHVIRISDCPTNHRYDQQQGFARENFTQNHYTNSSSSENGRIRVLEEKEFGSVAKNGKIVKTNIESRTSLLDDSVNNFIINESIHSNLGKNKFESANTAVKFSEQSEMRDSHKIDKLKLEEANPEVGKRNDKAITEIEQINEIIKIESAEGVPFKSIRNKDKKPEEVFTPKGDKTNKKLLTTPETAIRNSNCHSPAVNNQQKTPHENYPKTPIKVTKPILLLNTVESHPPSPTIEKSIQKYFNNLNKSMNSSTKHLDKSFNRINRNESPLSVGPSSSHKQLKQKGKDKRNISQKIGIVDTFTINKNKYENKLRKEEKSRSRMSHSRTISRNRHSLSPECQAITDRLYHTKINKQPCPKFVKYHEAMQRSKVKDTLKNYTFISKYLSDHEIYDAMASLQENNVPENKWALKLVDIVYDKLKAINAY